MIGAYFKVQNDELRFVLIKKDMGNCFRHHQSKCYVRDQMKRIHTQFTIIPDAQIRQVLYLHFMKSPFSMLTTFESLQHEYPLLESRDEWLSNKTCGCI